MKRPLALGSFAGPVCLGISALGFLAFLVDARMVWLGVCVVSLVVGLWLLRDRSPGGRGRGRGRLDRLYGFERIYLAMPGDLFVGGGQRHGAGESDWKALAEHLEKFLQNKQPSLREKRVGLSAEYSLAFLGGGVPRVNTDSPPCYLMAAVMPGPLYKRFAAAEPEIRGVVRDSLCRLLVERFGSQVREKAGFDDEGARQEIERCLEFGFKLAFVEDPEDDSENRFFVGLRRMISPATDKGSYYLFRPRKAGEQASEGAGPEDPRGDGKGEGRGGADLQQLSWEEGEEGEHLQAKSVRALFLPADYSVFVGDVASRLPLFDLRVGVREVHGVYRLRGEQFLGSALPDPQAVQRELGVVLARVEPPIPMEIGRQSEFKGRIRLHAIVEENGQHVSLGNREFENLSAGKVNLFGPPVALETVLSRFGASPRLLLVNNPDPVYKGKRSQIWNQAGNFYLHYEWNRAESRPRWMLGSFPGAELRWLSGIRSRNLSELDLSNYGVVREGESILLPAAELYLATRKDRGPWLVLFLEAGTSVAVQFDDDLGADGQEALLHVNETTPLAALEGFLDRLGVRWDRGQLQRQREKSSAQGIVRFVDGRLGEKPLRVYAKIPDGALGGLQELVIRRLVRSGAVTHVKSEAMVTAGWHVCTVRLRPSGIEDPSGPFLVVFSPAYTLLAAEQENLDSRAILRTAQSLHRQIALAFGEGLLASDLHSSNIGRPPNGGRFSIFDFGAFAILPIQRPEEIPRREGTYLAPELDAPADERPRLQAEPLQIWFEGILFFQLLLGDQELPLVLPEIENGRKEQFTGGLAEELGELGEERPRLAPFGRLVMQMLSWAPDARPGLQKVGEMLSVLAAEMER